MKNYNKTHLIYNKKMYLLLVFIDALIIYSYGAAICTYDLLNVLLRCRSRSYHIWNPRNI